MTNEIGFSSIYSYPGSGYNGPQGPVGATGATGTTGATGATGIDSNYITEVLVNNETGQVTLVFSDETLDYNAGIIKGVTGVYAGITALSVGNQIPILKEVIGGITLNFYSFQTAGLLGFTYDSSGNLKFTLAPNTTAGGISADTVPNRIVYAKSKNYIMSTDLIPQVPSSAYSGGITAFNYINFGGTTYSTRNVVADISESVLTVGPCSRGDTIISTDNFFTSGEDGINLDVSRASVYNIITPIGISSFNTNDTPIPDGQIMSVTLVVEGDDVWNFPSNVYFDNNSGPVFYPGTNILHMWKGITWDYWYAHFTARGFGVGNVTNPGLRGSCCYSDADDTKHCEDYVTENYCIERNGIFEALVPCNKNSCVLSGETPPDGICCTGGRCISDIDPNLCQTIGGYFISGITCGQPGEYPETDETDNNTGLCYNRCKPATVCCKDGQCLGNITKIHCEDILGGKIVSANSCVDAKCCDHINAPGACCIPAQDGSYSCELVDTPYECNVTKSGFYMGKGTNCNNNICCKVPVITTCYDCTHFPGQCVCSERTVTDSTCEAKGLSPNCNSCGAPKKCYKCDCVQGCLEVETCTTCPSGYQEGSCLSSPCETKQKTCYGSCSGDSQCTSSTIDVPGCDTRTCSQLITDGEMSSNFPNNNCTGCDQFAACFWCFPIEGFYDQNGNANFGSRNNTVDGAAASGQLVNWRTNITKKSYAPYRAVTLVNQSTINALQAAVTGTVTTSPVTIMLPSNVAKQINFEKLSPSSNKYYPYYTENPTSDGILALGSERLGVSTNGKNLPENIGPLYSVGQEAGGANFKCYYVSNYKYDTNNTAETTKEDCLKSLGYDTTDSAEKECQICNANGNIIADSIYPISISEELTFKNVEPYNDLIKNRKISAPFPPLWGRATYTNSWEVCGGGFSISGKDTAVIGGLYSPTSNNNSSGIGSIWHMLDYCHTKQFKYYWADILQEVKKSFDPGRPEGVFMDNSQNSVNYKINLNLNDLMGGIDGPSTSPSTSIRTWADVDYILSQETIPDTEGNYEEDCTVLFTSDYPKIKFDPYLKGQQKSFGTLGTVKFPGIITMGLNEIFDCSMCKNANVQGPEGSYGQHFTIPRSGYSDMSHNLTKEWSITGKIFYPDQGRFSADPDDYGFGYLNDVGEFYFYKKNLTAPGLQNGFGVIPVIYGRNMRYNIEAFKTSTVFFNRLAPGADPNTTTSTRTIGNSTLIVVPLGWVDFYSIPPDKHESCTMSQGGLGGGLICKHCGAGLPDPSPCCCDVQSPQDPGTICACPNTNTRDPGGDAVRYTYGFYAPSELPSNTGAGGSGGPGFAPSLTSNITTKKVQLMPGICVDIQCPDCNSYESC
jgi:hypothetical protein